MADPEQKVLIAIGGSGAGKSTFVKAVEQRVGGFHPIDDLGALLEVLALDRLVLTGSDEPRLAEFAARAQFVGPLVAKYQNELRRHGSLAPRFSRSIGRDEMEITDPEVWDVILQLAARSVPDSRDVLAQFARGHDRHYLERFRLTEAGVYPRSIATFLSALPPGGRTRRIVILHVTAPHDVRSSRNERRRIETGQYVPQVVMESVYRREILPELAADADQPLRRGQLDVDGERLPVLSVFNGVDQSSAELRHFASIVAEEIESMLAITPAPGS